MPKKQSAKASTKPPSSRREAVRIGALWKELRKMDMAEREIICLQDGIPRAELAAMWELSLGRISQIKAKAIRKMRHPFRIRIAIELGLAEKIGCTEEVEKKIRKESLEDALARYWSYRVKPTKEDEEEA